MFGMGGSEIIVILIIALLFLGPDKLPEAAKQISQAVRGIRKQTRELQQTIENDSHLGGAIRDIKSALRGDEPRRPPVRKEPPPPVPAAADPGSLPPGAATAVAEIGAAETVPLDAVVAPVTMPASAGEAAAPEGEPPSAADDGELAALIRPAAGTVAKGAADQDDKAS